MWEFMIGEIDMNGELMMKWNNMMMIDKFNVDGVWYFDVGYHNMHA